MNNKDAGKEEKRGTQKRKRRNEQNMEGKTWAFVVAMNSAYLKRRGTKEGQA